MAADIGRNYPKGNNLHILILICRPHYFDVYPVAIIFSQEYRCWCVGL